MQACKRLHTVCPFLKAPQSCNKWHSSIKPTTAVGNLLALLLFAICILSQMCWTGGGNLPSTCKLIAYTKPDCSK